MLSQQCNWKSPRNSLPSRLFPGHRPRPKYDIFQQHPSDCLQHTLNPCKLSDVQKGDTILFIFAEQIVCEVICAAHANPSEGTALHRWNARCRTAWWKGAVSGDSDTLLLTRDRHGGKCRPQCCSLLTYPPEPPYLHVSLIIYPYWKAYPRPRWYPPVIPIERSYRIGLLKGIPYYCVIRMNY